MKIRIYIAALFAFFAFNSVLGQSVSPTSDKNYVYTKVMTTETGSAHINTVQYFDGLGRPAQTVQVEATPGRKDLTSIQEYDALGRESNTWLPGAMTTSNGIYTTPSTVQSRSISTNVNDSKPYSKIEYEASPLNRVVKQYGPGTAWHNNNKAVTMEYLTNTPSGDLYCRNYYMSSSSDRLSTTVSKGTYSIGQLFVTKIIDEDGNKSYEFKDKLGQVVQNRLMNGTDSLDTYYVYDLYGNLRVVLPPKAIAELGTTSSFDENNSIIINLAYIYKYDNRNRCIAKKLPGCDWVCYVYDKADRLIFSQDGEQRLKSPKEWSFSIPDAFGRVVLTGICKNELTYTATDPIDGVVIATKASTPSNKGYTISNTISLDNPTFLSANFYDNYEFRGNNGIPAASVSDYNHETNIPGYGIPDVNKAKGQLTGTWSASLDGIVSDGLFTVMYYDSRGRLVQIKSNNHLSDGIEKEYLALTFTGQPKQRKHIHSATGKTTQTEIYTYTYDHMERLTQTSHSLNGASAVTLAANTYDDLGRLKNNTKNNIANLSTNYSYNVRSWTTSIVGNIFTENLVYNIGTTGFFNGNIYSMSWKASGDANTAKYTFGYDGLSRLTRADYTGGVSTSNFKTQYTYDKQGNMKTLERYGITNAAKNYGLVDKLTFTHSGNQVTRVTDAATNSAIAESADFRDYAGGAGVITYNKNGAMNKDSSKGITKIEYNCLNLPQELTISNTGAKGTIKYSYSADGSKLRTEHIDNNGMSGGSKTTDYVGNRIYEGGSLKRTMIEGGYIEGSTYHFYLTDHLGNNRVVANGSGAVIQKNAYYPFGMAFATTTGADQDKQPFKYGAKELDRKFGLNNYDFEARHYDPAYARFTTVDPMAEKYYSISPYAYCANNPIKYIDPDGKEIKLHNIVKGGSQGKSYSGLSKRGAAAMQDVMKTKEGVAFFSQFAKAGEVVGGHEFTRDGEFRDKTLNIWDYSMSEDNANIPNAQPGSGSFDVVTENGEKSVEVKFVSMGTDQFETGETIIHEITVHGFNAANELKGKQKTSESKDHNALKNRDSNHQGYKQYKSAMGQMGAIDVRYLMAMVNAYINIYNEYKDE